MTESETLKLIRGDDKSYKIVISNSDGPIDITGYAFFFTVKKNLRDGDEDALIAKDWTTHTDPTNGTTHAVLTNADTNVNPGTYYYDIQYKTPGGAVTSIKYGKINIYADVTRRTI